MEGDRHAESRVYKIEQGGQTVAYESRLSSMRRYEECDRAAGVVSFPGRGCEAKQQFIPKHTSGSVALACELGLRARACRLLYHSHKTP